MKLRLFKFFAYLFIGIIILFALDRLFGFYIYPTYAFIRDSEKRKQEKINEKRREREYKIFHISELLDEKKLDSAETITNELIAIKNEPQLIRFKAYISFERKNYKNASSLFDSVMKMTSVKFADSILINDKELYYSSLGDKGITQIYLNLTDSGLNNMLKAALHEPIYYYELCRYYERQKDLINLKKYSKKLIESFPDEKFYIDYYNEINK